MLVNPNCKFWKVQKREHSGSGLCEWLEWESYGLKLGGGVKYCYSNEKAGWDFFFNKHVSEAVVPTVKMSLFLDFRDPLTRD